MEVQENHERYIACTSDCINLYCVMNYFHYISVKPPEEDVYSKKEEKRNTKGIANSTSGRCNTVPQENYCSLPFSKTCKECL